MAVDRLETSQSIPETGATIISAARGARDSKGISRNIDRRWPKMQLHYVAKLSCARYVHAVRTLAFIDRLGAWPPRPVVSPVYGRGRFPFPSRAGDWRGGGDCGNC